MNPFIKIKTEEVTTVINTTVIQPGTFKFGTSGVWLTILPPYGECDSIAIHLGHGRDGPQSQWTNAETLRSLAIVFNQLADAIDSRRTEKLKA